MALPSEETNESITVKTIKRNTTLHSESIFLWYK